MGNIQETLQSLQPYVIGIRYQEGIPLIDVVFKEGWAIPNNPKITKIKGSEDMNYYMIFSDSNEVSIDDLLNYVKDVIKINQKGRKN